MRCFILHTLGDTLDKSLAFIDMPPEGVGVYDYCLSEGEPIGNRYPEDARIYLQRKHPGIRLSSLLGNSLCFLIVHAKMKEVLLEYTRSEVEILPFTLYNHKKRIHSRDYWIINPLAVIDCLDKERSEIKYFDDARTEILAVSKFVVDARPLKGRPGLFRVPEAPTEYFITMDLVRVLRYHDFTNIRVTEVEVRNGG